ncbi:hypothetical protein BGV40_15320 [Methanosarcina sp. Ant1]|nr:hypothetical protein BGV40_15320 [Methanosarcina sp. Ant1]
MKILIDGQTLSTPDINRGIGEVLLNILRNMLKIDQMNEIFLAVYDDFDKKPVRDILDKVHLVSLGCKLDVSENSNKAFDEHIQQIVCNHNIDVFWIPNPMTHNLNLIDEKPSCCVVTTFHDLIPLIFEDQYLKKWQKDLSKEYLCRLERVDRISDVVISVSDSTKADLANLLKIPISKIRTVHHGMKAVPEKSILNGPNYGNTRYILYVGGFDVRKNMENSVLVFKRLVENYGYDDLNYIIVCACDDYCRNSFSKYVKEKNLVERVKLTGYISDDDLIYLYKHAEAFFFPSLYEGFGLPVLEALALGVPVAVSNTSSLPEVVGEAGLLFDPSNLDDMADKLNSILSNKEYQESLRLKGIEQSKKFSWEISADLYLNIFQEILSEHFQNIADHARTMKIAYFSPVHPQKSGISTYSTELLLALKKYTNIDLFLDENVIPDDPRIRDEFMFYSYRDFDKRLISEKYDKIIYHMGNNSMHEYIYHTLLKYPGITVLHDYVLHPFIQHITVFKGDSNSYLREMKNAYGEKGESIANKYVEGIHIPIDFSKFPLNEMVIRSSEKVIVHNYYVKNMLNNHSHIHVIPLGRHVVEISSQAITANRKELNLNENSTILGIFGFMNSNKRINVVLDTFKNLIEQSQDLLLLIVGDITETYRKELLQYINKLGIEKNVRIIGYVEEDMYSKYLSCVDIVVNLRFPTMGETSGTLLDAMAFKKPLVVSNIGSYKEYPDSCCWKVDVDSTERELLYEYLHELVISEKLRTKMGENAQKYIKEHHDWDRIALDYVKLIVSKCYHEI